MYHTYEYTKKIASALQVAYAGGIVRSLLRGDQLVLAQILAVIIAGATTTWQVGGMERSQRQLAVVFLVDDRFGHLVVLLLSL